uniref:Proteinase inhibitor I42 chagasin domain-containing protein n=1 Tax=Chromera velia CCMP2878 TaxID=1169474 RepID=A0A0G4FCP5_9ALVE|mmetsp:Transcript_20364/g.40783  ORF Transcript_20364/g.40783 Transcript_20364/m.40783 type:complete len:307 (-) Transcript_20364:493-1413(-)|eukprot:Cvel_16189.t1-p1 / transcript=Cvel_16189.t1 / gene=Cvel_16189 / organism=Chromera_velia_CCMP2878 / gene_product=Protein CutA, putative / transcript_product=Protein CutA, putative / location=Cvel_scaffold1235:35520-36437(-) / protein_length=306 / sequence_SO=supercontig / SO=protein_coding / is_pseudo=false
MILRFLFLPLACLISVSVAWSIFPFSPPPSTATEVVPQQAQQEEVQYVVGQVTAPSIGAAKAIARNLLEAKLAACVNIVPQVVSMYTWEGVINEDSEVLLVIKSTKASEPSIVSAVKQMHPYDVPQVIFSPISSGSSDYLSFLSANTGGEQGEGGKEFPSLDENGEEKREEVQAEERQLRGAETPGDSDAPADSDVAIFAFREGTAAGQKINVAVSVGKKFAVRIKGNATTGYAWQPQSVPDELVTYDGQQYESPDTRMMGASGHYMLFFTAKGAGSGKISLKYVRPWEDTATPLHTAEIELEVSA